MKFTFREYVLFVLICMFTINGLFHIFWIIFIYNRLITILIYCQIALGLTPESVHFCSVCIDIHIIHGSVGNFEARCNEFDNRLVLSTNISSKQTYSIHIL